MGLVYLKTKDFLMIHKKFQCCFACNGFSMSFVEKANKNIKGFNAASPAMGLVYAVTASALIAIKVSMLLRLQWV